jgi:GT2 family glycosyltransferase
MNQEDLYIIIPTTRGEKAFRTITSALNQKGFKNLIVLIVGESSCDQLFINKCENRFGSRVNILPSLAKKKILPGEARNIGIEYAVKHGDLWDYILFIDDDINLPSNYAITLKKFISNSRMVAAMGRVSSYPVSIWSRIIDYSNFWWLQSHKDCINRGWLGAGASLIKIGDVSNVRFLSDIAVNEDTDFFAKVSVATGKTLGVCSSVVCKHCHDRGSLAGLIKYQFFNGYNGANYRYHGRRVLLQSLHRWQNYSSAAIIENKEYLRAHIIEIFGVIFSFFIMECGALCATYRIKVKK